MEDGNKTLIAKCSRAGEYKTQNKKVKIESAIIVTDIWHLSAKPPAVHFGTSTFNLNDSPDHK